MATTKKKDRTLLYVGAGALVYYLLLSKSGNYPNLDKYFSRDQFTVSSDWSHLQGTPPADALQRGDYLAEKVLNPIYRELEKVGLQDNLVIESWWRSEATNTAAGGVETSFHKVGAAADIRLIIDGQIDNVILIQLITALNLPFTELGVEYGDIRDPRTIHIAIFEGRDNEHEVFRRPSDGRSYDYGWLKSYYD